MKLIKSVRFKKGLKIMPRWIEFKAARVAIGDGIGDTIRYAKKDKLNIRIIEIQKNRITFTKRLI